jgi:hypothetical protein
MGETKSKQPHRGTSARKRAEPLDDSEIRAAMVAAVGTDGMAGATPGQRPRHRKDV